MFIAKRLAPFGTTIFTEMTLLANKHGAVNLAQGFPDFDGPDFIKDAAIAAMRAGHNQYARMFGIPTLNAAIASAWNARTGQSIDPETQVTVTSGATEAIAAAILGTLNPGDEVILFEPYYDSYIANVAMASAVPRVVTLVPPDGASRVSERSTPQFHFDPAQLRAAFTPKTRLLILNTPHNPTGKVFTREELALIADLCIKHNVLALTDEVYENLTYDPALPHISLATLPGMADRTITCSSLGKSFSLTGWKIGWASGAPSLMQAVRAAHQFLTFATSTPFQHGAAAAVGMSDSARAYLRSLVADFTAAREFLGKALERIGCRVYWPAGAYFIMADWTAARLPRPASITDDLGFCRWLTEHIRVAAVPPSVFYTNRQHGRSLARFAFCKKRTTLEEAVRRLEAAAR